MALRKMISDNSVKSVPQSEQTRKRDSKPNTIRNNSLPRKENKNFSQKNSKFIAEITGERFGTLE